VFFSLEVLGRASWRKWFGRSGYCDLNGQKGRRGCSLRSPGPTQARLCIGKRMLSGKEKRIMGLT